MSKPLIVPDKPCASCPYRRDTPPGIWDRSEYEKLREYDVEPTINFDKNGKPIGGKMPALARFDCHHSPDMACNAICRGWLSVHCDSLAVRLLILGGKVTPEQVFAEPLVELYATGNEAADAGIAGIDNPSPAARQQIDKLQAKIEKRVPKHGRDRQTKNGNSGRRHKFKPRPKKAKRATD